MKLKIDGKTALGIVGGLLTLGVTIVDSIKGKQERAALKDSITKEVLETLKKETEGS